MKGRSHESGRDADHSRPRRDRPMTGSGHDDALIDLEMERRFREFLNHLRRNAPWAEGTKDTERTPDD